jgi:hypothetical protein
MNALSSKLSREWRGHITFALSFVISFFSNAFISYEIASYRCPKAIAKMGYFVHLGLQYKRDLIFDLVAASLLTAIFLFDGVAATRYFLGLDAKFDGVQMKPGFRGAGTTDASSAYSTKTKLISYLFLSIIVTILVVFSGPEHICTLSSPPVTNQ